MSAPAPARQVIWPCELRGWSLALSALGFAMATAWIGVGSPLEAIAFLGAGPYASVQGAYTSAGLHAMALGGIAAMVFAVAVIIALPGLARQVRSLRTAVTVCAGLAALLGALTVPLVIMVAAPAMPFPQPDQQDQLPTGPRSPLATGAPRALSAGPLSPGQPRRRPARQP